MRISTSLAACAVVALSVDAACQAPTQLIGLTRNAPMVRQEAPNACANVDRCFPPLPPVVLPFAGGTAYDAANGGAWVSDGFQLLLVSDQNCNTLCGPVPVPTSSPNIVCTGLACSESTGTLWMVDSGGVLTQIANTCPPTPITRCATGLVTSGTMSTVGLAADESNGLLFIAETDFGTGSSRIHVSTFGTPCQIFDSTPVAPCGSILPFGSLQGLAVDWCNSILYMTDGLTTQGWQYVFDPVTVTISYTPVLCCTVSPGNDPFVGLCIRPPEATPFGSSCASGSCPSCPMVHDQVTDAAVGNPNFVLDLQQAPSNSLAYLIVGAGPCAPGPIFPPLCGPVNIGGGSPILVLGPTSTGAGVGCAGAAQWTLSVPLSLAFCGNTWSSQVVVLCPSVGPLSTSLSNCLTWDLTGS